MTTYEQGDILLVPFPFTDQSSAKQRPAVVLSSARFNSRHLDIILAPITSQMQSWPDEAILQDWREAGLLKASVAKPILASIDSRLVRRRLGALSPADLAVVRQLFKKVLDLE